MPKNKLPAEAHDWSVDLGLRDDRTGLPIVGVPEELLRSHDMQRFSGKVVHWCGQCKKYHRNWKSDMRTIIITDRGLWYAKNLQLKRFLPFVDVKALVLSKDYPEIGLIGLKDYDMVLQAPSVKHQKQISTIIQTIVVQMRQAEGKGELAVQFIDGTIEKSGLRVNLTKEAGWKFQSGPLTSLEEVQKFEENRNQHIEQNEVNGTLAHKARYAQEVAQIVQQHDPAKIDKVPLLLSRFEGREEILIQELKKKYGTEFSSENGARGVTLDEGGERENPAMESRTECIEQRPVGSSPNEVVVDDAENHAAAERIKYLIKTYAPEEEHNLPEILYKAQGKEKLVAALIEERFGASDNPARTHYAARAVALLEHFQPEKVQKIPDMLEAFEGHEAELVLRLEERYNVPPGWNPTDPIKRQADAEVSTGRWMQQLATSRLTADGASNKISLNRVVMPAEYLTTVAVPHADTSAHAFALDDGAGARGQRRLVLLSDPVMFNPASIDGSIKRIADIAKVRELSFTAADLGPLTAELNEYDALLQDTSTDDFIQLFPVVFKNPEGAAGAAGGVKLMATYSIDPESQREDGTDHRLCVVHTPGALMPVNARGDVQDFDPDEALQEQEEKERELAILREAADLQREVNTKNLIEAHARNARSKQALEQAEQRLIKARRVQKQETEALEQELWKVKATGSGTKSSIDFNAPYAHSDLIRAAATAGSETLRVAAAEAKRGENIGYRATNSGVVNKNIHHSYELLDANTQLNMNEFAVQQHYDSATSGTGHQYVNQSSTQHTSALALLADAQDGEYNFLADNNSKRADHYFDDINQQIESANLYVAQQNTHHYTPTPLAARKSADPLDELEAQFNQDQAFLSAMQRL